MELEERLENTSRFFQANEFGQVNVCTDVNRERSFQTFLQKGLASFLRGRAAHPNQTDLLHVIAMAISPQLTADAIENIVAPFEEKQIPAWIQTRRLMGCLCAHSFPLHYAHRFLLVSIVSNQVVMPNTDSPQMLAGAVPHLLAAIHTFATHTARNVADAHAAHVGLVRIATQTGQEWIVREVFYILLAQTLEDRNRCKCPSFCPHAARGALLRQCISVFNISRHHANEVFTAQAFMALNASIEEHMEPWMKESKDEPQVACLLSSLLHAAEALFIFFEGDSSIAIVGLLEMCIQLLHHPDIKVRDSASSLLSVAFAYMPSKDTGKLMPPLLQSIKLALDCQFKDKPATNVDKSLFPVIAVSARSSPAFASNLLTYLLEERSRSWKSESDKVDDAIANGVTCIVTKISCSNPVIAFRQAESIRSLLQRETSETAKGQLVASLLATRQAYPFGRDDVLTAEAIDAYLRESRHHWMNFLLARHALVTGNFAIAKSVYDGLLSRTSGESSFLWISSLSKVAEAESLLLQTGAKGISQASTLIQTAISYLELLNSQEENMVFQIAFLRLRLDFLDVSAATRAIYRETRLSGIVPKDTTRVGLHLVNILKSWAALATRYQSLYRRHGLLMCPQSRTAIRTLQSICRQIASAGFQVLNEAIANRSKLNVNLSGPKGDQMHPTIRLIQKVNASVVSSIDKSVEPAVRVTVLMELLEGVHRSPIPFPRSFTMPKKVPKANLRVSLDPSQKLLTLGQDELSIDGLPKIVDSIAIYPGTNLAVVASGSFPSMFSGSSTNLSQLLLWTRITFLSSLHDGYAVDADDDDTQRIDPREVGLIQDAGPIEIHHFATSSNFVVPFELPQINYVGLYRVDCRLGCRDTGCGEWELPQYPSISTIVLRVTRRLDPTR